MIKTDIWHYLKNVEKPIVMYGMGNGADKILSVCESLKIEIKDFFASDGFVRGHSFHGKKVLSYSDIKLKYGTGNFIVLLSFASSLPDVIDNIKRISNETELYAPDVPVHGDSFFNYDFYVSNDTKISEARKVLYDDYSKKVFDNIIKYKLSGKIEYLFEIDTNKEEVYNEILDAKSFINVADLGAYNGDSARELAEFDKNLSNVIAFEPDKRNFRKLSEYAENEKRFNVLPFQLAAWNKSEELIFGSEGNRNSNIESSICNSKNVKTVTVNGDTLDNIVFNTKISPIDYIKFDVEGAENEALDGCINTIKTYYPAMLISAYHKSEDLFELPVKIHNLFPDYKLFLRKFKYIPAWDLNLYAIKK